MRFHFAFVALAVLAVTACASDPPTQAPVTVVTSPPKVVVIEKPAPPKVVYVEKPVYVVKPAPPPKIVKVPVPKAPSHCKGLPQLACINVAGCQWIKHSLPTDKHGRPLTDYCRLKATASVNK
jgi:hypothetical protein